MVLAAIVLAGKKIFQITVALATGGGNIAMTYDNDGMAARTEQESYPCTTKS